MPLTVVFSAKRNVRFARPVFERGGVEFIDENGGGPGLRLRKLSEENNGSERANYGFMGGDLISGKVPHILSADCRRA
jgi:hypothetical protein